MPTVSARSQLTGFAACAFGILVLGILAGVRPETALYVAVVLAGPLEVVLLLGGDRGPDEGWHRTARGGLPR